MSDPTNDDEKPATPDDDFAALFAASEAKTTTEKRIRTGDTVRGRVIVVGSETAFVAIGGKSEAVISLGEFRDPETGEVSIAVGDQLEATVTDDGSRSGSIVLKKTLGRGGHVPGELEQALAHGIAVEGTVTGQNKGQIDHDRLEALRIGGDSLQLEIAHAANRWSTRRQRTGVDDGDIRLAAQGVEHGVV